MITPKIIFFARGNQTTLFPKLKSNYYESIYVALTLEDKSYLLKAGEKVEFCFESYLNKYHKSNEICSTNHIDLFTSFYSDRFWCRFDYKTRKLLLNIEFMFWNDVFKKYKPLAIINEVVAVEHAEVMMIVAKKYNVNYWAWLISPFKDKQFYWLHTPNNSKLPDQLFLKYPDETAKRYALSYISNMKNNYTKPYYSQSTTNWLSIKNLLSIIRKIIITSFSYLTKGIYVNKYVQFYYYNCSIVDVKRSLNRLTWLLKQFILKNIYSYPNTDDVEKIVFPLHYEPEATLSYFSEFYQDQESLISNLSKTLGVNQVLIVKEHPQQPGALLQTKFSRIRKRTSNVYFLPADYPTKKLIEYADIVVTIASSMGWESLIMNKKVVVFGDVFYDKHPSIFKFDGNWSRLKNRIRNLDFQVADDEQNVNFIANFWSYCQPGLPFIHKGRDNNENIEKLIESIEKKVKTIC